MRGREKTYKLSEEQRRHLIECLESDLPIAEIVRRFAIPRNAVYSIRTEHMHRMIEADRKTKEEAKARSLQDDIRKAELFAQKRYEEYGYRLEELTGEERLIYLEGPKHSLNGQVLDREKGA
jgi:predicted DNA-binding protein YlxM (UPF0122 family)